MTKEEEKRKLEQFIKENFNIIQLWHSDYYDFQGKEMYYTHHTNMACQTDDKIYTPSYIKYYEGIITKCVEKIRKYKGIK